MNKERTIADAKDLLTVKVTDEPFAGNIENFLKAFLVSNSEVRFELLELRVEAYKELCKKREQYRHPKDKEYTDFDRQTMLSAAVADVEAEYQLVSGLEKLVAERVELIKILLEAK